MGINDALDHFVVNGHNGIPANFQKRDLPPPDGEEFIFYSHKDSMEIIDGEEGHVEPIHLHPNVFEQFINRMFPFVYKNLRECNVNSKGKERQEFRFSFQLYRVLVEIKTVARMAKLKKQKMAKLISYE